MKDLFLNITKLSDLNKMSRKPKGPKRGSQT